MTLNRETVHCASLIAPYDAYQPKSLLCSTRGSLVLRSCRFLLLLLSLIFCQGTYANEDVLPRGDQNAKEKAVTQQLAQTCSTTDAKLAPAMVAIHPGRFSMGSEEGESDEKPPHLVSIPNPFAISRCEITVGQFKQFVQETNHRTTAEENGKGCTVWNAEKKQPEQLPEHNWKNPGFAQTDAHPVVCVSWDDAQAYVKWLSHRSGAVYRLPTEAEWEYVARAGTTTTRYYQDGKQCDYANGLGQEAKSIARAGWTLTKCSDGHVYTAPVASFGENQFGLFDMLGNVWEWTEDCWHGIFKARQRMARRGKKPMAGFVIAGWFGAVRGATILRACGRLSVAGATPMLPASTWVFVSPGLFDLLFFVL
jgi:formylglycine-generating enzyme required for sulfatase activity